MMLVDMKLYLIDVSNETAVILSKKLSNRIPLYSLARSSSQSRSRIFLDSFTNPRMCCWVFTTRRQNPFVRSMVHPVMLTNNYTR